jgi:hypothetical protein
MNASISRIANTQNELLMRNLTKFYTNRAYLHRVMRIINGDSKISLRIVDWFVTNFAKQHRTHYLLPEENNADFHVYDDYKLKLKAYTKRRLDPFCRFERILIPYNGEKHMQTTIGQLNFFKWAIETNILEYIESNYESIELDMNARNSSSRNRGTTKKNADAKEDSPTGGSAAIGTGVKTRKKREELSISAYKCIKKENIKINMTFG